MKSRTTTAKKPTGIEKVAYITLQTQKVRPPTAAGRAKCQAGEGGFVLTGMYESLAKTFATHQAAADYARDNGYTVKTPPRPTKAELAAQLAHAEKLAAQHSGK